MVRDVQTQQGLGVDVLAIRIFVGACFADVGAHDRLLVAFGVVVAGGKGRLAEARYGQILFFDVDVGAVAGGGEVDGFAALWFAEVGEGALERGVVDDVVGCCAVVSCLARDGC